MAQPYIMLIDDDQDDIDFFASALKTINGIRLLSFDVAKAAFAHLDTCSVREQLPALIISDMNMPGMNGTDVLLALKSNSLFKHIPVIMYSSNMSNERKAQLLLNGATDCYKKAWSYDEHTKQVSSLNSIAIASAITPAQVSVRKRLSNLLPSFLSKTSSQPNPGNLF
jgi:CheY-like chemotaxis protein